MPILIVKDKTDNYYKDWGNKSGPVVVSHKAGP
jgi:hypothetical protein